MSTVERLYEEVMLLTADEQDLLIARLLERRLEPTPEWLDAWADECEKRIATMDADSPGKPWEEVRERMWAKIHAAER